MIDPRSRVLALLTVVAVLAFALPAGAANFDGNWNMTAVTTSGHCWIVPIGMSIKRGRVSSTSGSFAFYPIRLGGHVSGAGHINLKAVAGPRVAHGTGRLGATEGKGRWSGRGPSGLCSGVWNATRS